jgi:hypothetical protein
VGHAYRVPEALELKIALDPGRGDRLVGRVLSPRGEARPFDGWLGLISALDAELSPAGLDPPAPAARSPEAETAHVAEPQREEAGGDADE